MTRFLLISAVLVLLLLAVAGWTVRGLRWALAASVRRPRGDGRGRVAVA